jgi:hypothetical protein
MYKSHFSSAYSLNNLGVYAYVFHYQAEIVKQSGLFIVVRLAYAAWSTVLGNKNILE